MHLSVTFHGNWKELRSQYVEKGLRQRKTRKERGSGIGNLPGSLFSLFSTRFWGIFCVRPYYFVYLIFKTKVIFEKSKFFLPKEIVISMWRSCNLRQVDILLMTCLLSLTGHYWVKGDDGWETSIQTILHPHKVSTNIIYIFDATFIFWWIVFWVFFVTTHFCPFWMKYLTSSVEI